MKNEGRSFWIRTVHRIS